MQPVKYSPATLVISPFLFCGSWFPFLKLDATLPICGKKMVLLVGLLSIRVNECNSEFS
uniref:Uncharacterized protein n=1 Tax=Arundo donax TaxID=35708 RepID=A0A0A9HAD1_ARUDO